MGFLQEFYLGLFQDCQDGFHLVFFQKISLGFLLEFYLQFLEEPRIPPAFFSEKVLEKYFKNNNILI